MKACLISCFGHYEERIKYVKKVLEKKNFTIKMIFSDFDHIAKTKRTDLHKNLIRVKVPAYKKNISIQRIFSHYVFSKKIPKVLDTEKPDLLYVMIPPNFLCREITKYHKKNHCKVIFDIYDIWPESFPIQATNRFPFSVWKGLRDRYLQTADYMVLECRYYETVLKRFLASVPYEILYLCREDSDIQIEYQNQQQTIHLCYLGSINNIIDIDYITRLLAAINKRRKVFLHIIGDGENTSKFLQMLGNQSIDYQYYGKIYSPEEKSKIFAKCLFGINIYRKETAIGLTMKSMEYFQAGLPVLTYHIKDTDQLVIESGLGYVTKDINKTAQAIAELTKEEWETMHQKVKQVYQNTFAYPIFETNLLHVLTDLFQ